MSNGRLHSVCIAWFLLVPLVACGPGAKGDSLLELEALRSANYSRTIRQDPEAADNPRVRELREAAERSIAESDTWYAAAIDAWEEASDEIASEFATQGVLLFRAAEAYSRAGDARDRMEDANATYQSQLERRNRYNDMLAANEEVIGLLSALRELYNQTEDCRADLLSYSSGNEARTQAGLALQDARSSQRLAENNNANRFASSTYEEAVVLLGQATSYYDSEEFSAAYDSATRGAQLFMDSNTASQSEVEELVSGYLGRSAASDLNSAAVALFGEDAYVDARGLVVVLRNLFPDRRSEPRADQTYQLDQVAQLIRDHRRYSIVIEGHTSDRGTRESNMTNSRSRADYARDYFAQRDVRSSRMTVESYGEDYPRFNNANPDGRSDNNRIEVLFRFDD
jgi:outer membrane protein OmpA-like peptidoglycan-associated protein